MIAEIATSQQVEGLDIDVIKGTGTLIKGTLDPVFSPHKVAVIGATDKPGSVGRTVFQNLLNDCSDRTIYPVNPNRSSVLGIPSYRKVTDIGDIDLAVIVTPSTTIPSILTDCYEANVKAAVVISAG